MCSTSVNTLDTTSAVTPIGVAADHVSGAALLLDLLHAVGKGLEHDAEFAECVARTTAHLEKQQAEYFVLETGEIVSMSGDDPAESVRRRLCPRTSPPP
ncbi:hypothetical protein ACIGFK_18825 [Streptomyces sp. NPDC085524]|uniref:DUF7822 domain-containing protein n=1 Tax=unclassified Streptomyces TaxID=2593676 RepID=UPI0035E24ED2